MTAIENCTFSISAEHTAFIEGQVASGAYATASEVVQAGLRVLEEREKAMSELRSLIQRGLDSGVSTRTFDEIMAAARAEARTRGLLSA